MVQESNLYMLAALVAFSAFIVSMYYCFYKKSKSDYGIYPILILGLIALAKSIELYEKYTYKLKSKR
tara:strand:+ start:702 stop:902 length:201 start_codon:yes stop_codon:yes gene_type:complete